MFAGGGPADQSSGSLVTMFDGKFRASVDRAVKPVGAGLERTGMSPDHLTVMGLLVAMGAATAIGAGYLRLGLLLVVLAALPDLFDGALAKAQNTSSQRGAFFDSVIDRVTDAMLFGGVAWYLASEESPHMALLPFAVMALSSVISYERAKAESLGLQAKGGLMERAERIIALCLGLLFPPLLIPILWITLVLTGITAVQRFVKVWKQADVAPVTAAKIEMRRSRRQSRRVVRTERRRTRIARAGRTTRPGNDS
jgi:CDP-diacylglycerol--glycerol-3-phosphate 3-phosphatidyltransferase